MAKKQTKTVLRLDKFCADMGLGTRSEVKRLIQQGRLTINGQTVRKPETKLDTIKDEVCLDGQRIQFSAYEYVMLYKPAGCVTATKDDRAKTVLDCISVEDCPRRQKLFPVGRLDKDTEGLLLLTDDGELAHKLLSPGKHVPKTYFVRLKKEAVLTDRERFWQGMDIGDEKPTLPAKLKIGSDTREVLVTIEEGRYHQIKRMFESCGNEVVYLKRLSMGSLKLDGRLKPGEYRRLTQEEIQKLKQG